ncbi:prolipoprotein diacylglyceryl transferase [Actinoplanes sp. ATCC 53533]|uniref:prolipoprotein diacylglyceryl transferase n=1 Tax=Actinoplanes sp. ATCC 53533 TaxID=1288362 RepID=UPI0018F688E8|nr:prolipoprotein diacylglyceryl transferase [Actinoplanes sp. ATCC 53533]
MNFAAIPSPTTSVWHVLGLPIRAYALCIVAGIIVAVLVMEYRLRRRGVAPWASLDMAVWAVPFGIVGARIYHVVTSPGDYFGAGGDPIRIFQIWEGGLGIWGSVLGGALGAWFAARQLGLPLSVFADALAPALPLAQAVGRIGNWFNNELYGSVTTLPWGLRVHDMDRANPGHATVIDGKAVTLPDLYHPAFLYELVWNVGVAGLVFLLDRRFKFGRGRAFAIYVMAYTVGRFWIEMLRVDEANHLFGVRLNVFTSVVVFLGALIYFLLVKGPREYVVPIDAPDTAPEPSAESDISQVDVGGAQAAAKPPTAYQVVSEERFHAYERTGVLPPAEPAPLAEADDAGSPEAGKVPAAAPASPAAPAAAASAPATPAAPAAAASAPAAPAAPVAPAVADSSAKSDAADNTDKSGPSAAEPAETDDKSSASASADEH